MDDKDRTLKALEDMKESMAYAVRRRATADVVSLEAQVLALQTQLETAELKAKEWIDVAYEAASQKEELKRELERVERETVERCAKVCEDYAAPQNPAWVQPRHAIYQCAKAIRALPSAKTATETE